MTEKRLEKSVELDADPEQVWRAIATGPGISAWFVPHEVEEREGGAIGQRFGSGFDTTGRVTAWEPGRRFAYGSAEAPPEGMPDHAYEFLVEARDGGGTVLRFAQSGFSGDGWEDEYRSFDTGWDLFFGNLRAYLEHFAGQPVRTVMVMAYTEGGAAEVWPRMHAALGLAGAPAVGDPVTLSPDGPAPIAGVVDVVTPEFLGLRSAHGLHRIGAEGEAGCGVSAYHYFYGEPVDDEAITADWQAWMDRHFPAPPTSGHTG
ncbi:MAG: SRPBCC domain-containing protein [Pseudonocardiales bacterium]|nr:SRPBCC domain-containing protein [Pseudonocardiales bacterium]